MLSKTVKTIDGSEHLKGSCRKINGEYYLVGDPKVKDSGQCYLINDKYYKYNTGYIVYDERLKEYVVKNNTLLEAVIDINSEKEPVFGYFSLQEGYDAQDYPVILIPQDNKHVHYILFNEEAIKNSNKWIYCSYDDTYHLRKGFSVNSLDRKREVNNRYKETLPYSCSKEYIKDAVTMAMQRHSTPSLNIINSTLSKALPLFKKYSFGFEFETTMGQIPLRTCRKVGLMPLRDGSIKGIEYASIPYTGLLGMDQLNNALTALQKHTEYDESCSLHVHIGGVPRTESFLIALFRILSEIENDIFEMFPFYKRQNCGIKRKHYTKPLPFNRILMQMDPVIDQSNMKKNFAPLFEYLSMGDKYSKYENGLKDVLSHPSNPNDNSKWNIKTRYHWFNFIPIIFGNKETLEIRIHTPTYDFNKIFNFILFWSTIFRFVEANEKEILTKPHYIYSCDVEKVLREGIIKQYINENYKADSILLHLRKYYKDRQNEMAKNIANGKPLMPEHTYQERLLYNWLDKKQEGPSTTSFYKPKYNTVSVDEISQALDEITESLNPFSTSGNAGDIVVDGHGNVTII